MALTKVGSAGVDHPKVSLEEDLDAIKKTASDTVDSSASTTGILNVQVPKVRRINGIPLTGDVALTDTVLDIYTKKVIDTKLAGIESTGYNPVYLNGYLLDKDVTLTAGDVGPYSNAQIATKRAGFIPTTRKVANKALSADITVNAADVNVYTKTQINAKITGVLPTRKINNVPLAGNITLTAGDLGAPLIADVVPHTFKVNGVALTGTGITLSGASGSYSKAEFDALLTAYIPLVNKWGLGIRAVTKTSPESGFYSYTTGGPDGSTTGVKVVAGKGTIAFPTDRPGIWYSKDSTTYSQIRSGRAAPLPNYWAPLKDSLAILTGEGPHDTLTINGSPVKLTSRSVQFSRASTATYIGRDGVLKTAAVNEPRFEKDGLLIEMQATNHLPYSGVFNTTGAIWNDNYWVVASKPKITAVDSDHFKVVTVAEYGSGVWLNTTAMGLVAGKTYTVSLDFQVLTGVVFCGFEYTPGGLTQQVYRPSDTPTMKRISFTYKTTDPVTNIVFYTGDPATSDDIASTFIIGRVQVEEGSVQTSYIPTSGTAVTRAPDYAWIPEPRNLPQGQNLDVLDLTIAFTMGSWDTDTTNPVVLSSTKFGYVSLGSDFVGYKPSRHDSIAVGLSSRAEGLLAVRMDTTAKTASVLANEVLQIKPYTVATDWINVTNLRLSTTLGTEDNNLKRMHIRNFRIWHRALTDDQMRGLS